MADSEEEENDSVDRSSWLIVEQEVTVSEYSEESSRDRDVTRSMSESMSSTKDERYWRAMETDVKG